MTCFDCLHNILAVDLVEQYSPDVAQMVTGGKLQLKGTSDTLKKVLYPSAYAWYEMIFRLSVACAVKEVTRGM